MRKTIADLERENAELEERIRHRKLEVENKRLRDELAHLDQKVDPYGDLERLKAIEMKDSFATSGDPEDRHFWTGQANEKAPATIWSH